MRRRILLVGLAFFIFKGIQAQTASIKGSVLDQQSKAPLRGATVRLKSTTDAAFSKSVLSDSAGNFVFAPLSRDSFSLSVSFVGFNAVTRGVRVESSEVTINISLVPSSSSELATVIITSTPPLATQKGDTLQISASELKVNPDASSEDLVRKVPGVTIENGQVKAHGENVQKVTIDGRELFGDDATAALRNLPAEIVDKIQIFDRLSDQAQFTGFDDGSATKSINIVTKANMRNGQFGRVFAGYGTNDRYSVGGNTTILHQNRRISVVGLTNNINQQNFSQQDLLGVTSNSQRGGGGGGFRGGGGGGGGNQGGGNFGGFGNNANFLVGQQNGINKTNAFGINYSDLWGPKITMTGSYFFNNANNTTNQFSGIQYLSNKLPNRNDSTLSSNNNTNHRFNMRFEYRIDSSNQLIITPSLSFQNNQTNRSVLTSTFYNPTQRVSDINNITNSHTSGNNLNNTILYRHSFPKKGRTFSINLNTSYNQRNGDVYTDVFQQRFDSTGNSSLDSSKRFTDQSNSGYQLSANVVYTEPLGANTQLQFNYNPSYSNSQADQQAFRYSFADEKYSLFDTTLSNKFNNDYIAQNAGITYRYGNRDNQFSFGASYQHSVLQSDRTFPNVLTVNKSFDNILPNAMARFKLSSRSNIRMFYRASINQPSVTQLQDVYDITNRPYITAGNPDLRPQYNHIVSTRYTFTNTAKSLLFVGNLFVQAANNYIANATFVPLSDSVISSRLRLAPGEQLTKPVNLDGYLNLRSFFTFAVPVKFIKSNLNLNTGVSYSKLPGILNSQPNLSKAITYTLGSVIASNISPNVDFTVSYSANFNTVENQNDASLNSHYFQHVAGVQLNLLSKSGWFFQNDLSNQLYTGLAQGFNQNYTIWNMSAGKKFLKSQKGELKLSVFDLLKQNRSITRNITETYIQDVQNQVLQQYFMLTFTYNLRNFGTAAARAANRNNNRGADTRF